jgi:hypothetical protein
MSAIRQACPMSTQKMLIELRRGPPSLLGIPTAVLDGHNESCVMCCPTVDYAGYCSYGQPQSIRHIPFVTSERINTRRWPLHQ